MERDRKLFYEVAEVLELYPEKHQQEDWIMGTGTLTPMILNGQETLCGSTQCTAGWGFVLNNRTEELVDLITRARSMNGTTTPMERLEASDTIMSEAAKMFGLTEDEASKLFLSTSNYDIHDWPAFLRALGDGADMDEARHDYRYA